MTQIFDHLGAIVVASLVGLIALGLQVRRQELAVEATVSSMARRQVFDTTEWMTQDLLNLGSGVAASDPVAEAPVDSAGLTKAFVFWRRFSPSEAAARGNAADTVAAKRIVYQLRWQRTVTVNGSPTRYYQVVRCHATAGTCPATEAGGTSNRLTQFRLELLDAAAAPAAPSLARFVRVRVAVASPLAENAQNVYLPQTYWATTLPLLPR